MNVQPYLFFGGRCEEAIEFYKRALDAKVEMLMRFADSPEPPQAGCLTPGYENKIMHASFSVGAMTLMASDGRGPEDAHFQGFGLSLSVSSEAEAQRRFAALAEGGEVRQPLIRTFFSPCFGMVADRFGVLWMVLVMA